jgi:hypothetical protein
MPNTTPRTSFHPHHTSHTTCIIRRAESSLPRRCGHLPRIIAVCRHCRVIAAARHQVSLPKYRPISCRVSCDHRRVSSASSCRLVAASQYRVIDAASRTASVS